MFPWMFFPMMLAPKLPRDNDKPPTLYALLNSIVNYDKSENEKAKIKELTTLGRSKIFDFNYPLSDKVNKEEFEINILNHFLMRRIGYDTFTSWQIALNSKLNEIMPYYNKLFDSLEDWNILNSGEEINRILNTTNSDSTTGTSNIETNTTNSESNSSTNTNQSSSTDSITSSTSNESTSSTSGETENTSDRRNSNTPQNQLSDVRSGTYVDEYNYDTDNNSTSTESESTNSSETTSSATNTSSDSGSNSSTSSSENSSTSNEESSTTSNGTQNTTEKITRTPLDKINIYKQYLEETKSVYSMLYKDLESLFYQLV